MHSKRLLPLLPPLLMMSAGSASALEPAILPPLSDPADSLVETLQVPAGGQPIETSSLRPGVAYRVLVRGTVQLGRCAGLSCPGGSAPMREGDAAFVSRDGWATAGEAAGLLPGGLWINGAAPEWGPFRPDHLYAIEGIGAGAPLVLELFDGDGLTDDNAGHLQVELYRVGGEPLQRGEWFDIPDVRLEDGPEWLEMDALSAAASVVMVAAAQGALPAWPSWVGGAAAGRQTDWGPYLGRRFQLPGQEAWSTVTVDAADRPVSGIAGAIGFDDEAALKLETVLEKLGLRIEQRLESTHWPLAIGKLATALEQAALSRWPTLLELSAGGEERFVVVTGFEAFEDRIDLWVIDPVRRADETDGPVHYRVYGPDERQPIPDAARLIDAVMALWSISAVGGGEPRVHDFMLDDSTPWFTLRGEGLTWGRSSDVGQGALGSGGGPNAWGLTWAEAPGGKLATGEGIWRVLAPERGTYELWVHIPPGIDPGALVGEMRYYLMPGIDAPIAADALIGTVVPSKSKSDGWHRLGVVSLSGDEEAFIRLPIQGEKGRRVVCDAIFVSRIFPTAADRAAAEAASPAVGTPGRSEKSGTGAEVSGGGASRSDGRP